MNHPEKRDARAFQTAGGPFGPRLRMERERRRITLDSIAANTKISVGLLKDLERGNVSRWPSGIYRRSFIKAYAQAIGLDPDDVAREFQERFPDREIHPDTRPTGESRPTAAAAGFRLTLVPSESPFSCGSILRALLRRGAAVIWDVGVVLAAAVSLFMLLGQFWRPLGIFVLAYYVTGVVLLGNTPGVCLFAAPRSNRRSRDAAALRWAGAKWTEVKAQMKALVDSATPTRDDATPVHPDQIVSIEPHPGS